MQENVLLRVQNVSKSYPGTRVLTDTNLVVHKGEILGLVGENGAGKSTLIKILAGAVNLDSGSFVFDGKEIVSWNTMDARRAGMITVYQELSLVPELSVAENIFLGAWPQHTGFVDFRQMETRAAKILKRLELDVNPAIPVKDLSIASRQMVEIGRALQMQPKLLILDEPTSSLSQDDADYLHEIIKKLKAEGTSIIYVSHRLEDVMDISDRIAVLKDGVVSGELDRKDFNKETIVSYMIGRNIRSYGIGGHATDQVVLQVNNLTVGHKVKDVSFSLKKGEILGIAGLMGSGRSTLVKSIFGAAKRSGGTILINGKQVSLRNPSEAIALKMGFLPEDRRLQGLFMQLPIRENISISDLGEFSRFTLMHGKKEDAIAQKEFERVNVKAPSIRSIVSTLSGGNQQKIVLARWLAANCDILLFDEPTRGIDVGSKEEIYRLIDNFAKAGGAAIIISSEMPELLALSDRIIVLAEGHKTGEFSREEADEAKLMNKMIEYHRVLEEVE